MNIDAEIAFIDLAPSIDILVPVGVTPDFNRPYLGQSFILAAMFSDFVGTSILAWTEHGSPLGVGRVH